MNLLLTLLLPAQATPRVANVIALGTSVTDVVVSSDGRWVAAVEEGSQQVRVLDTDAWEVGAYAVCGDADVAGVAAWETADELRFYVGCSDGSLDWLTLSGSTFTPATEPIVLESGAVLGVAAASGSVFAVAAQAKSDGNPQIHILSPSSEDAVDSTGSYPQTLGFSGFVDMEGDDSNLYITHGGDNVSRVAISSGSPVIRDSSISSADGTDILAPTGNVALIAAGTAGVMQMQASSNDLSLVISSDDGLGRTTALCRFNDQTELLVADSGRGEFVAFTLSSTSSLPGDVEQYAFSFAPDAPSDTDVVEVATIEGYAVAGTTSGQLWVLTDRPWVEMATPSPSSAVTGDTVSVSFTTDVAGDWELRLGATTDDDGDVVASGSISEGETGQASLVVDGSFSEGDNPLRVVVESDGLVGHDVAYLSVDNPPSGVSFSEGNIGFGNQQITVSFDGITDEDLDHYTVYITTTPFDASEFQTGGPSFDGADEIDWPVEIVAAAGEPVTSAIAPLTNGTTYYLAIRAYDIGGQEGPMSNVVSATPQQTYGAAALAGEKGGFCGTAAPVSTLLAALGGLLAVTRRKRGLAVFLAAATAGLLACQPALAREDKSGKKLRDGTVEVRYGPMSLTDKSITNVFGDRGNEVLWVEFGPAFDDYAEFKLGMGFFQELGFLLAEDGSVSSEHDMLTAFPMTANGTIRLDFFEEQVLVPVASMGADYWFWRENWYVADAIGGDDRLGGAKWGWHWAVGGQLLLDSFERGRSSELEARTGISDAYLVAEYRGQTIGATQSGLEFTGTMVTIGLKVDY